jgi:hypothetical protein
MLGFGRKNDDDTGLPVVVQSIHNAEAFATAVKIWDANANHIETDAALGKQYLRLGLIAPAKAAWIQRDQNRVDSIEVILTWVDESRQPEIYVIRPYAPDEGNADHALNLLRGLLSGPATVPVQPGQAPTTA